MLKLYLKISKSHDKSLNKCNKIDSVIHYYTNKRKNPFNYEIITFYYDIRILHLEKYFLNIQ